ncbi:MAG: hypothetical protein A2X12_06660 [Bacteroidetes bacterium GWE2_29_8]|nr:MAG: hypothetical protein A2X12_06660 [Bacteroidetes bacterium GWE2_29_8]OFY22845.1 MAG: hypothetical protein A2X02_07170 [Bacteroidetes bacterium GWF2_29_10]
MQKKWYRVLPLMALSSGILVIFLLATVVVYKPSRNIENIVNRKIAFDKLKQIKVKSTDNVNSKAFFDYINKMLSGAVIKTKWLVSPKGEVIYAKGEMTASTALNSNIYSLVDAQNRGLIDAVECNLDSIQKGVMYVAASIRREGEHNDIYGHLVIPLMTNTHVLAGFVGVSYTLDDSKTPIRIYVISIVLIICFFMYWLSLPIWVYYDSRKRNNKYILWTLFVLIGNLPAYIAYHITRR